MFNQIDRIRRMEALLDEATLVIDELSISCEEGKITPEFIEKFNNIQDKIDILSTYYQGPEWREDFNADCDNLLPPCLKRGVLTEDAVFDLLTDNLVIKEQIQASKNEL